MHVPYLESVRLRRPSRRALVIGAVAAVLILAGSLLAYARYFGPVSVRAVAATEFIVAPDTDFDQITRDLKAGGYIKSMTAFRIAYGFAAGLDDDVREGGYLISPSMDARTIAEKLSRPPYLAWITFPPGWRKEQIAAHLADKLGWTKEEERDFIMIHTATAPELVEGVYFGDTYLIPSDQEPRQVAARMRDRFNEAFAPYAALASEKNVTWTEALIMASLIEREAAKNDKHLVAGILWNRINDGMRLQVDATLQYFRGTEGNWWPQPNPEDKTFDSPFNTYRYAGLPPHPIANPSIESIEAALNPEDTSCMYYLHDNDGQIHCSASYAGHMANVDRYLR